MQILFFDLYSGFNISKRTNNILFVSTERKRERYRYGGKEIDRLKGNRKERKKARLMD